MIYSFLWFLLQNVIDCATNCHVVFVLVTNWLESPLYHGKARGSSRWYVLLRCRWLPVIQLTWQETESWNCMLA